MAYIKVSSITPVHQSFLFQILATVRTESLGRVFPMSLNDLYDYVSGNSSIGTCLLCKREDLRSSPGTNMEKAHDGDTHS